MAALPAARGLSGPCLKSAVVVAALLVQLDYGQVAAIIGVTVTVMALVMAGISLKRGKGLAHA